MKLTQKQSHTKCKLVYMIRFNGPKIPVNSPLAFIRCFWACPVPGRRVWKHHSVETGVLTMAQRPCWPSSGVLGISAPPLAPLLPLHHPRWCCCSQNPEASPSFYPHFLCLWGKNPGVLFEFSPGLFSNICFSVRTDLAPFSTTQHVPTPSLVSLYLPSQLFLHSTDLHQTLYSPYLSCLLPVSPHW